MHVYTRIQIGVLKSFVDYLQRDLLNYVDFSLVFTLISFARDRRACSNDVTPGSCSPTVAAGCSLAAGEICHSDFKRARRESATKEGQEWPMFDRVQIKLYCVRRTGSGIVGLKCCMGYKTINQATNQ